MAAEPQSVHEELTARIPYEFNWHQPNYAAVCQWRANFLARIRRKPGAADELCGFYKRNPIQFIVDFGVTFDPRNVEIGLPSKIPFVPFPRQIAWLAWVLMRWRARERGLTDKSRGSGASWLAVALGVTLALFHRGLTIGYGSRTEDYVDEIGNPKSLFFKARMFLNHIPPEFRFGWNERQHSRKMRILFPHNDSALTGECGDGIGRGDRTSIYVVDEAAHLEHPELAESSLSDTTNCRIDISTPPVVIEDNTFVNNRERLPAHQIFTFHYRDDPRRDAEWEAKKRRELAPLIFDREYGVSYDKGGAFFTRESFLVEVSPGDPRSVHVITTGQGVRHYAPVPMPVGVECVYAIIDTALKTGQEHDGLAVCYFAKDRTGLNQPLTILDYDYTQIPAALLATWLPTVFQQLELFAVQCKAVFGSLGAAIEDRTSGTVLLQQAENNDWPARAIDSKLTQMGKVERGINISGAVHRGEVKLSELAYHRVVDYKGVTKNHLLSQVLGFRPGIKDMKKDDVLDTVTYGVAMGLGDSEWFGS